MDISFETEKGRFNYRVSAVIIRNDRLLTVQDNAYSYSYLPGGRVKMGETAEQAMQRELGLIHEPDACSLDAPVNGAEEFTLSDVIPDESLPEMDEALLKADRLKAVREAVQSIPDPVQRSAFRLTQLQGRTAREAADALGISERAVRAMNARSLRCLRRSRILLPYASLDDMTCFSARKSASSFQRDHTSIVEAAVLWREQARGRKAAPTSAL